MLQPNAVMQVSQIPLKSCFPTGRQAVGVSPPAGPAPYGSYEGKTH